MVETWGRFLAHRARTVLVVGVLGVIAAAAFGIGVFPALSNGGFDDPDTESAKQLVAQRDLFGGQEQDVVAMYSSDDLVATDQAFETWRAEFAASQSAPPQVAAGRLKFDVPGQDGPVSVLVEGPFKAEGRVQLVPSPCRGVLELDGKEIGRPLLSTAVPATL